MIQYVPTLGKMVLINVDDVKLVKCKKLSNSTTLHTVYSDVKLFSFSDIATGAGLLIDLFEENNIVVGDKKTVYLKVKIVEIHDEQPGFIKCILMDINQKKHIIEEKIPIVFTSEVDINKLSRIGFYIPGVVLKREMTHALISTLEPYGITSNMGTSKFQVRNNQINEKQTIN